MASGRFRPGHETDCWYDPRLTISRFSLIIIGLCKYLSDKVDTIHHDWHWHAQHILILCRVHFQRGIEKLVRPGAPMYSEMMSLPDSESMDAYQLQLDRIHRMSSQHPLNLCPLPELIKICIEHPRATKAIKNWATHKRHAVIANGLCARISKIPSQVRERFQEHTNAIESIHLISYSGGKQLQLRQAILMY
jgi:hypothetical protein